MCRRYGLFERRLTDQGTRWVRIDILPNGLPLTQARTYWQNALLCYVFSGGMERALRPLKEQVNDR